LKFGRHNSGHIIDKYKNISASKFNKSNKKNRISIKTLVYWHGFFQKRNWKIFGKEIALHKMLNFIKIL